MQLSHISSALTKQKLSKSCLTACVEILVYKIILRKGGRGGYRLHNRQHCITCRDFHPTCCCREVNKYLDKHNVKIICIHTSPKGTVAMNPLQLSNHPGVTFMFQETIPNSFSVSFSQNFQENITKWWILLRRNYQIRESNKKRDVGAELSSESPLGPCTQGTRLHARVLCRMNLSSVVSVKLSFSHFSL